MTRENVLITGASRGIGLALAKRFAEEGCFVIATCRNPDKADELKAIEQEHEGAVRVIELDVALDESVEQAVNSVFGVVDRLDVLFNNAGIKVGELTDNLEAVNLDDFHESFETNTIAPVRMVRAFLPLLEKSDNGRVVNMSSGLGDIGNHRGSIPSYVYGVSKAALNFLTRAMADELKSRGVTVVAITPGWVRTRMGGENADLAPDESARDIVETVKSFTEKDAGKWFNRDGEERVTW